MPTMFRFFLLVTVSVMLFNCGGGSNDDSSSADASESSDSSDSSLSSVLKINEIVASAVDDGDDWFELYALEDISDLSTYSIVDDNTDREPQNLPAISLSSGEFVVILAVDEDDEAPESDYYVTFKLGSDDALTLYQDGSQIDQLDWEEGDASEGYSYGLYVDGSGTAQTMEPTQGSANQALSEEVISLDSIIDNDADLRINEIMAKSSDDGEDWVEFYVTGDSAVYLGDYYAADDNGELFALPSVTVNAGTTYRVYASSDNQELDDVLPFNLGSSDIVSLYLGDDLVDSISYDKGQALLGYTYGRYPDGSDALYTLVPTPDSSNQNAEHSGLVINEIVASQNDDSYDWFELYNNSDQAILLSDYQVIDSSDDIDAITLPEISLAPNEYQVFYATDEVTGDNYVAFKLGKDDELSLLQNDETIDYIEWQESDVSAGFSYGLKTDGDWAKNTLSLTQGTSNQEPNIFVNDNVESIYFTIDTDEWQDLLDNAIYEEYHPTSVTYQGVTLDEVAIRTKGNSSLTSVVNSSSERYSFNIDVNEYVDGQKLLGMKKFVLNNMFNDPSYMREYIAYDLLEEMGVNTPRRSFVNVYVNDELKGLYLMVEFVDSEFIERHFDNEEGDLYKPDGTGSDLQWIDDDFSSYADVELKTNEDSSDNGAFMNFVYEMEFGNGLSVIDADSVLRYMAVSVSLSNLDSYHGALDHNYYIYEQDNVFYFLPWDLNEAFGSFSMGCNRADIRELYIDEPTDGELADKPMLALVFADDDHLATYHEYLWSLINGSLSSEAFAQRVSEIDELISEHVANDPTAFYSYSEYQQNQTSSVDGFYGLTSFVDYRVANMTQQLNGEIASSGDGSGFCGN